MNTRLEKRLAVRLYCFVHQAYRSVAFAVGADWAEFAQYYRGPRLDGLKRLLADLGPVVTALDLPRTEVAQEAWSVVTLLARWSAAWSGSVYLTPKQVAFIGASLRRLIQFLESDVAPEYTARIELRMDLCFCEDLLLARCGGWPEVKKARRLEHFWQAPWITPVHMEEILGSGAESYATVRRSA